MDEFVRELKESAAGLHDGMGGHADYCALLMGKAASVIAEYQETFTAQALAKDEHIKKMQGQIDALMLLVDNTNAALARAKAMQQAETERADANERDAERYRYIRTKERMMLDTDDGEARMTTTFSSADEFDDAVDQAMSNV